MKADNASVEGADNGPMLNPSDNGIKPSVREPADRYYLVYSIFCLLGLATLLPWNFFITANGYWMYKFRDVYQNSTDPKDKSSLQASFTSYLSVASMVPNTLFLMLNTVYGHRISQQLRLIVPLVLAIILFIVTITLVTLDTDQWQTGFFAITLLIVVLINCNTAIFQGALFGLAGTFPVICMTAVMNGQALGGIFASLAALLSLSIGTSHLDSALGYFLCAMGTMVLALISYIMLGKLNYFRYYTKKQFGSAYKLTEVSSKTNFRKEEISLWEIFKKIRNFALSVCLVLFTTLAVFPAITVLIVPNSWPVSDKYFVPLCCFLLFNIGDFVGRTVAGFIPWPSSNSIFIPILCILRLSFIPLFMLCNVHPRHHLPVVLSADAFYIGFMILFALSNGYLISKCMMHGPKKVEAASQQTAGAMMGFFLGLGLMLGAGTSYGIVKLL